MHGCVGVAHQDREGGHTQAGAHPGGRMGGDKLTQTVLQPPCSLEIFDILIICLVCYFIDVEIDAL